IPQDAVRAERVEMKVRVAANISDNGRAFVHSYRVTAGIGRERAPGGDDLADGAVRRHPPEICGGAAELGLEHDSAVIRSEDRRVPPIGVEGNWREGCPCGGNLTYGAVRLKLPQPGRRAISVGEGRKEDAAVEEGEIARGRQWLPAVCSYLML